MKKETISELTRQQLSDSLFKLMKEKPIEKISIREITEDCGFPRSTFYYHFEDIYDLAAWALAQRTIDYLREGGGGYACLWGDSLLTLFNATKEHYQTCRCVVNSNNFWRVSDSYCKNSVAGIVPDLAASIPEAAQVDGDYLRFLTSFYGHSILDVCVKWFRGDMTSTPEEMVDLLDSIINRENFVRALRVQLDSPELKVPLQVKQQNLHMLA